MNETALLASDPFLILVFVPYTLLSFISFNLELANNNIPREHSGSVYSLLQRMLFYTFYQPYLFSLIVVYPNFERQLNERSGKQFDGRRVLFNVARMIFWWALIELMLHFFYFSVIMFDDKFAAQLPKNEFVSVGMAMGWFEIIFDTFFGIIA
jgi:hypothetical protein